MPRKITKAVFPVAGRGTRFMPATTAVPKELFPILDTPLLEIAVREAIEAGAEDIIFVTSRDKPTIEHHFANYKDAKIHIVYQDKPRGLGHAVLCARELVGDYVFSVTLPDDLIVCDGDNVLQQMAGADADSVIAAMEVPDADVSKYGIIDGKEVKEGLIVNKLVEKPSLKDAPSNTSIVGRYILPPRIFDSLQNLSDNHDGLGEIQLTSALDSLARDVKMVAYKYQGRRFDCGQVQGWLQANIEAGLKRADTRETLKAYLQEKNL